MSVHWIGGALVVAQLAPALGVFPTYLFFVYLLNLLWLLLMSAFAFVLALMALHTRERED